MANEAITQEIIGHIVVGLIVNKTETVYRRKGIQSLESTPEQRYEGIPISGKCLDVRPDAIRIDGKNGDEWYVTDPSKPGGFLLHTVIRSV